MRKMITRVGAGLALCLVLTAGSAPPPQPALDPMALEAVATAARTYTTDKAKPPAEPETAKIQREKADLTAQQSMAWSADKMLFASWVQIVLGLVSALGLGISIWISAQAIKQSDLSLVASTKATEAQLRAYLTLKSVEVDTSNELLPTFYVKLFNSGQTPALKARIATNVLLSKEKNAWHPLLEDPWSITAEEDPIGAGEFELSPTGLSRLLTLNEYHLVGLGQHRLIIQVFVRYQDIFGDDHEAVYVKASRMTVRGLEMATLRPPPLEAATAPLTAPTPAAPTPH